jgi:5'-3' exonuclease
MYRALVVDGGCSFASWAAAGNLRPFVKRLLTLRRTYNPGVLFVAWDTPRAYSSRRAISADYKAHREAPDPRYITALCELREVLPVLDVVQVHALGAEADDLLYTLGRTLPARVLLASNDKDLLQAVGDGVDLLRFGHTYAHPDTLITLADIAAFGIKAGKTNVCGLLPKSWGDWLTLAGDPTDGVPGLDGVGPATAHRILVACPDFVTLLLRNHVDADEQARRECAARDARTAKYVEQAIKEREALRLSHELVSLRLVEVETIDADPGPERAAAWLREQGLGRYVEEVAA